MNDKPFAAPEGYQPRFDDTLVYDDEVDGLPHDTPWRRLFAGGSNRPHWIRTGKTGERIHLEEWTMFELACDNYAESFDNELDAFWAGDVIAGGVNDDLAYVLDAVGRRLSEKGRVSPTLKEALAVMEGRRHGESLDQVAARLHDRVAAVFRR